MGLVDVEHLFLQPKSLDGGDSIRKVNGWCAGVLE